MDQEKIKQLVVKAQNSDSSAFAELIGLTQRFAYGYALRITGNPEESRDIVQDAYIRAWTNISKFNNKVTFHSWFFSILRNLSIDFLRKVRSRQLAVGNSIQVQDNNHPGAIYEASELHSLIQKWIPSLSETQQLVFILRDMEDLSIREVADQTGLTESSIKSNLYLSRKKLAVYLRQNGYK
jgi:RNA polymerase sigma-70 factor (ECF subfamily)